MPSPSWSARVWATPRLVCDRNLSCKRTDVPTDRAEGRDRCRDDKPHSGQRIVDWAVTFGRQQLLQPAVYG